jgi:hypothetical protein
MRLLAAFHRRRPRGDEGVGLLLVVSSMLIASTFAFASLGYAIHTQKFSRGNQDWNGALAAAQAGVDDYIAYLNRNDNYARTPVDCVNVALRGPNTGPNTCGWSSSTPVGWKPLDAGNPGAGQYHYDIDPSKLNSEGIVQVTSTGRVGSTTRTLQVGVGRGGSTDFLYYTDHEDADPDNKQIYPSGMNANCANYWWSTPNAVSRRVNSSTWGCSEITFIGGDELDGPVHTNDTPYMTLLSGKKPKFSQGLQTSDPRCKNAKAGVPSTYGNCDRSYSATGGNGDYASSWPQYSDPKYLPDNSDEFKNFPGCQYSGSTRIKFLASGKMTVWSKESKTTPACGGSNPMGVTVDVPNDNVIYVKGGTAGVHQCKSQEIGDGLPLGTFTGSATQAYEYDLNMLLATQYCGQGNAYIEGVVKGRVTLATSNSITVTGDLVLADGIAGSDMLGLVASNSVEVFHPWMDDWWCKDGFKKSVCQGWGWRNEPAEATGWPKRYNDVDNGNKPFPTSGVQVSGSIQTLLHSFFVQSYNKGTPRGKLYVRGSIAQKWRGIVGQGSGATGYLKDYRYDKRLRFASPPYFPQWTNAVWASNYTGEIATPPNIKN